MCDMDWFSTIIGALIGFLSSIGAIIVQRKLDRVGNVEIFAKLVYDRATGSHAWGFYRNADSIYLEVPLWLEIHNLSNSTRMLRDINLFIASEGNELKKMLQLNRLDDKIREDFLFANDGSYSLSISGREIKNLECSFALVEGLDKPCFDEILLRYYDEKNRSHVFSLGHVEGNWKEKEFPRSGDWKKMKEIK